MGCTRKKICALLTLGLLAIIGSATYPRTALAQQTTTWRCWHHGEAKGSVSIWWGHTAGDAAWACNKWISACGNARGGCTATEL